MKLSKEDIQNYATEEEKEKLTERRSGYIPLYIKQKKILDRFIEEHPEITKGGLWFSVEDWPELYDEVAAVRETETLWQDINRYVSDKIMDKVYGEDVNTYATEEEKNILREDIYSHPQDLFAADRDRLQKMRELEADIAKTKKKIKSYYKRYGAHEMGVGGLVDRMVGKLEDKWRMNDLVYSGYQVERRMAELLRDLWKWATNYTGVEESKSGGPEWEHSVDTLLPDEDKEFLLETKNYEESVLKESLADSIAMKHIEDSNYNLDEWEDAVRQMSPEDRDEAEFEFQSARDGVTWYIQKWTIPSQHREEKKERRKLYQKYLNRLRKVKKEYQLAKWEFGEKPDFTGAIDTNRLKNMSDEELDRIANMFK